MIFSNNEFKVVQHILHNFKRILECIKLLLIKKFLVLFYTKSFKYLFTLTYFRKKII